MWWSRRKETRPGSTAFTNCTGIATRLKLMVPLQMPCTALSFSLLADGCEVWGWEREFFIYATFFRLASRAWSSLSGAVGFKRLGRRRAIFSPRAFFSSKRCSFC